MNDELTHFENKVRLVAHSIQSAAAFAVHLAICFDTAVNPHVRGYATSDTIFHTAFNCAWTQLHDIIGKIEINIRQLEQTPPIVNTSRLTPAIDSYINLLFHCKRSVMDWLASNAALRDPPVLARAQMFEQEDDDVLLLADNFEPVRFLPTFDEMMSPVDFPEMNLRFWRFFSPKEISTHFFRLAHELYGEMSFLYDCKPRSRDECTQTLDEIDRCAIIDFLDKATNRLDACNKQKTMIWLYQSIEMFYSALKFFGKPRPIEYFQQFRPTSILPVYSFHENCLACEARISHCYTGNTKVCSNDDECESHAIHSLIVRNRPFSLDLFVKLEALAVNHSRQKIFDFFYQGTNNDKCFKQFDLCFHNSIIATGQPFIHFEPEYFKSATKFHISSIKAGFDPDEFQKTHYRITRLTPDNEDFRIFLALTFSGHFRLARKYAVASESVRKQFINSQFTTIPTDLWTLVEPEPTWAALILNYCFDQIINHHNSPDLKDCFHVVKEALTPKSPAHAEEFQDLEEMVEKLTLHEECPYIN